MALQRTTTFAAANGAVMTDEVGVITGDVTLETTVDDGGSVSQRVQYQDADEWYGLTGSPTTLPAGEDIDTYHNATVARLTKSG